MKRKFADYPNWPHVLEKRYTNAYFDNEEFKGNIGLLTAVKAKERFTATNNLGKEITLIADGFKWLEIYPEKYPNIAISVSFTDDEKINEWYFDIAKNFGLTDNGIPYIDDLYLDVVLYESGEYKILDEDELMDALESKDITKEDVKLAYKVKDDILSLTDGKIKELKEFSLKYFRILNAMEKEN